MTLVRPLFMQAASGDTALEYSALDVRDLLHVLVATEGVVSGLRVAQRAAGANMSVDVASGVAVITGDDVTSQGKYQCTSTATENVTVPAAPGSGTRVHRVVARVKDKLHNGTWTTYEWTLELLADTGSGTPATPASAVSLATVSVSAGQVSVLDSNITNSAAAARLFGTPRPTVTDFVSAPSFGSTGAWVDFTSGQWPPISFTVPPVGALAITVAAGNIANTNASTATIRIAYRLSGAFTVGADPLDSKCVLNAGESPLSASRRTYISGLPPGGSVTVTPQWRISSGNGSTASISAGQLAVEPVP